jgi:hypothetical protein
MTLKMSFIATCFSLKRPSSGNYQLEKPLHCIDSSVNNSILLQHVFEIEKCTTSTPSLIPICFVNIYILFGVQYFPHTIPRVINANFPTINHNITFSHSAPLILLSLISVLNTKTCISNVT